MSYGEAGQEIFWGYFSILILMCRKSIYFSYDHGKNKWSHPLTHVEVVRRKLQKSGTLRHKAYLEYQIKREDSFKRTPGELLKKVGRRCASWDPVFVSSPSKSVPAVSSTSDLTLLSFLDDPYNLIHYPYLTLPSFLSIIPSEKTLA